MSWSVVESQFCAATAKAYEGLFTQGSGYLHVRGSLEEPLSDDPQNLDYMRRPANVTAEKFPETKTKWGTYVPGIYGPHPLLNWELINLPWFLGIALSADGEKLDMELCRVERYTRELCLKTAVLKRSFVWHTSSGNTLDVLFERFASAARPHLFVQRVCVCCERETTLTITAGIDADVRTSGYDHFRSVELQRIGTDKIACTVRTDGEDTVTVCSELRAGEIEWDLEKSARRIDLIGRTVAGAGGRFVLEKRTAVATSRDLDGAECLGVLESASAAGYDELRREHTAVWSARWDRSDVVIEGDEESQLAMRCSIYHLLRAHVPGDDRVAIDAKGYAGDAYFGRFFWDTEMYLLPFYLYTDPERARTLVGFRLRTLPGAKETAAAYGYQGAKYPWEADRDGRDSCPNWQYADHEVHVTADVVYGIAHYAAAADNPSFLTNEAAEVIIETARYWMQRIDRRERDPYPSLLGVMGPDEYTPISNNNSYTNRMVRFALRSASEIGRQVGVSEQECAAFARAADLLPIPRRADGLVLQCEEFESLAEPRFDELWTDRSRPFAAQVSQERLYRSKCLKQADVLMMMLLFPNDFSREETVQAWEYYLPYTTHDSSLSAGAHAIVACRLGLREQAWEFWKRSSCLDLDFAHGGAAEGIHIANAGANWQIAVFGFAGMATAMNSDLLALNPDLPDAWNRLAFPAVWKGTPVRIGVTRESCAVSNEGSADIEVAVCGERARVRSGETVSLPVRRSRAKVDPRLPG